MMGSGVRFPASAPQTRTSVSTCSRLVVGCKSPQTGTILDSSVGGSFGPELKFAGYDAIILTGRAAQSTLVWIKDDVVELRSAAPYTGMKTQSMFKGSERAVPALRSTRRTVPW